ncbi:CCR4-Not complex component [Nitzschia inconspicua]|uniref:CCR4-Not complex component n=1 Tax=Nitzschia inconspicua TaxID=303405 RepID=A0A9K3PBU2_9STRA|nr:CCR4-Not complex component [Nitzschia inconspicua]
MSNARKLQTEIDRVMKKVDEGVELFDEIWEKVYSAANQSQKEKYEMDLKKEIKKLQRLRDQIKSWISSAEVKDKEPLVEARKLIETKMEAFKTCERETKTKTYSKEGLMRAEQLSPEEEAKQNTSQWISDYLDRLNSMVQDTEVELERLQAGKGKKTNRHLIDDAIHYIANHKFHVNKLEGIMRLVNNDVLDVDEVDKLKDDLDYYFDSFQDEEYQQMYDEDVFYESLGLDELQVVNVDRVTNVSGGASISSKKTDQDEVSKSSKGSKDNKKSKKGAAPTIIPLTIGRARVSKGGKEKSDSNHHRESSTSTAGANSDDEQATGRTTPSKPKRETVTTPTLPTPTTIPAVGGASMAAILKRETEQQERERQQKAQAELLRQQQQQQAALLKQQQQQAEQLRQQQEALRKQQQEAAAKQKALEQQQQAAALQQRQQQEAALRQQQQQAAAAAAAAQQDANNGVVSGGMGSVNTGVAGLDIISGLGGLSLSGGAAGTIGGVDAAVALGSNNNSAMLQESFTTLPTANEQDRSNRAYTPQNPYPAMPPSFPSTPSTLFENPAIFEKLGTDALFFIFYYKQGTYQQYLAARELKKQSWRFHKKYMTWFQRHEEPKVTTDEYEQGTYVYFDYETGWCTRIKQDFRFEYSFLEDSLQ